MNLHLKFSILIILFVQLPVSLAKSQYIGDCHYYDDVVGKCNLTFVCTETVRRTNFFNADGKSICLNQHLYHRYTDGFSKYWIGTINFENCEQLQIPTNIFTVYDRVHTFNMSDIGVESLQTGNFVGAKRLMKLIATHNQIVEVPAYLLNQSAKLVDIDFSFNRIDRIDSDAFPAENRLEILNLSFNNISELSVNNFQKLTELKRLLLSNNHITDIPSLLFHKTAKLVDVDLSFNEIRNIDDFAFSGDLNLMKLNLSHNHLTVLHGKIVENLSNLTQLDISENQIALLQANTFESLQNLMYLELSGNPIKRVSSKIFVGLVKLQQLRLSRVSLSEVEPGTFSTLKNLQKLDLSNNKLKTLNVSILPAPPNHLQLLSIGNNQLRELNGFTSARIADMKIAGIDKNRFNCSYFEKTFRSITWKHLESISNRINCSTIIEVDEIDEKPGCALKTSEKYILVMASFNIICLAILMISVVFGLWKRNSTWLVLQKSRFVDRVYRRGGTERLNDIEINE